MRTRLAALLASLVIVATGVSVAPGPSYAGGGTDETRTFKTSPTTDVGYLARRALAEPTAAGPGRHGGG